MPAPAAPAPPIPLHLQAVKLLMGLNALENQESARTGTEEALLGGGLHVFGGLSYSLDTMAEAEFWEGCPQGWCLSGGR